MDQCDNHHHSTTLEEFLFDVSSSHAEEPFVASSSHSKEPFSLSCHQIAPKNLSLCHVLKSLWRTLSFVVSLSHSKEVIPLSYPQVIAKNPLFGLASRSCCQTLFVMVSPSYWWRVFLIFLIKTTLCSAWHHQVAAKLSSS